MILRLILLILLLTANNLGAQEKMTLLLDWFINPDHGPIIIAQEKGYFSDQNLEVEIIAPTIACANYSGITLNPCGDPSGYPSQLSISFRERSNKNPKKFGWKENWLFSSRCRRDPTICDFREI